MENLNIGLAFPYYFIFFIIFASITLKCPKNGSKLLVHRFQLKWSYNLILIWRIKKKWTHFFVFFRLHFHFLLRLVKNTLKIGQRLLFTDLHQNYHITQYWFGPFKNWTIFLYIFIFIFIFASVSEKCPKIGSSFFVHIFTLKLPYNLILIWKIQKLNLIFHIFSFSILFLTQLVKKLKKITQNFFLYNLVLIWKIKLIFPNIFISTFNFTSISQECHKNGSTFLVHRFTLKLPYNLILIWRIQKLDLIFRIFSSSILFLTRLVKKLKKWLKGFFLTFSWKFLYNLILIWRIKLIFPDIFSYTFNFASISQECHKKGSTFLVHRFTLKLS